MPEKCRNSVRCDNTPGNYTCHCVKGFHGRQCDVNANDCEGNECANGATCIDLIDAYHCACAPGFGGRLCETNVDECASGPCANGGECVDLVNGYRCICPLGYTGAQCQVSDGGNARATLDASLARAPSCFDGPDGCAERLI